MWGMYLVGRLLFPQEPNPRGFSFVGKSEVHSNPRTKLLSIHTNFLTSQTVSGFLKWPIRRQYYSTQTNQWQRLTTMVSFTDRRKSHYSLDVFIPLFNNEIHISKSEQKIQRRPEWHCEMFKKRSIKMSFSALKVLSEKYPASVSISLYFWDWQMLAVVRKYVWGNFYWIFLLLSVPGISLIHWTLDAPAPDTFSFNSLLTSALPRLLCHILLHASGNNCKTCAAQWISLRQLQTFTIQFPPNSRYLVFVPSQLTSPPSFLASPDVNVVSWRFLLFPEVWGRDLDTLTPRVWR